MVTVKTTRYYVNIFGSIQKDFALASKAIQDKDDVLQYIFPIDELFFQHFQRLNIKTLKGQLMKGKTLIGAYERNGAQWDRPRPRMSSKKFRDNKRQE